MSQSLLLYSNRLPFVFVSKLEPRLAKRFFTFYNEAIWSIQQNKRGTMKIFLLILTSSRVFCQSSMLLWPNRQCCFLSFSHVCYSLLFNRSSSVVGIRKQLKISAKNNQPSCSDKSRYTHTNVVYLDLGALSSFLFFREWKEGAEGGIANVVAIA